MFKLLILEDEKDLGLTIAENLTFENQKCELFNNCSSTLSNIKSIQYDIFILDINLPDGSGLDVANIILGYYPSAPIIFISANSDPELRLRGLELGAFDFINKPFTLRELQIKIDRIKKELLALKNQSDVKSFGPLKINFSKFEITDAKGITTTLTHKECAILKLFIDNLDHVISRDQILDQVWGQDSYPNIRTIDNYIVNLRKWCDSCSDEILKIQSIRGIGYKMSYKGNS
jgi:two-component system alkaline phosphatase synthesis response regulator PhoP